MVFGQASRRISTDSKRLVGGRAASCAAVGWIGLIGRWRC
jgi:hypothetical protein